MKQIRIGIDLGGTKIETIAIDPGNNVLTRFRIETPEWNYATILDTIRDLLDRTEGEVGVCDSLGIGIPGAISPKTDLVKNANSTYLNGQPLKRDLEDLLQRPVHVANDANCFALSEALDGSGRDYDTVFGVILGTGVGGGIVMNKQLIEGGNRIAGEWGHTALPRIKDDLERDMPCYCGQKGCIEALISGPAIERQYFEQCGNKASATRIAELADQGDSLATLVIERFEDRLARALSTVVNILDPDAIILGGGLSRIRRLYKNLPSRLEAYVFSDTIETAILPPRHGDSSGVRGAAWLGDRE